MAATRLVTAAENWAGSRSPGGRTRRPPADRGRVMAKIGYVVGSVEDIS